MFDIYHADRCELTLAKVDAVDGVAQVIANVTPYVAHAYNKMLSRAQDPGANGTWLSKLTE